MGIVAVQVGFDQGMKLVYRDIDSLWHQLKVLEKREGKYYTDILECQPSIELSDEEWSKLYKRIEEKRLQDYGAFSLPSLGVSSGDEKGIFW